MSIVPFRGKKRNIIIRLGRGESVDEIAAAENTSPAYIHNVMSEQRKRERASAENAPPPPTTPPATRDLQPVDPAHDGRVPTEPTPSAPPVAGGVVTENTTRATPIEDPVSDNLRRNLTQTRNRIEILRQRNSLAHQNLQLSLEERREREAWEERQMRLVIFNQCPDPRDMFTNARLYTDSMLRILESVEPFRTFFFSIVDINRRRGLWGQDQTAPMLRACLAQSFALIDTFEANAPISRTLVRDHVLEFLRGLVNPIGYCPRDHTPVLPCGPGGFCATYHWWSIGSPLLVRTDN